MKAKSHFLLGIHFVLLFVATYSAQNPIKRLSNYYFENADLKQVAGKTEIWRTEREIQKHRSMNS